MNDETHGQIQIQTEKLKPKPRRTYNADVFPAKPKVVIIEDVKAGSRGRPIIYRPELNSIN